MFRRLSSSKHCGAGGPARPKGAHVHSTSASLCLRMRPVTHAALPRRRRSTLARPAPCPRRTPLSPRCCLRPTSPRSCSFPMPHSRRAPRSMHRPTAASMQRACCTMQAHPGVHCKRLAADREEPPHGARMHVDAAGLRACVVTVTRRHSPMKAFTAWAAQAAVGSVTISAVAQALVYAPQR